VYSLEYLESTGRADRHAFHHNVVDYYMILKEDKALFSEQEAWTSYCLAFEIDNLNKRIGLKKMFILGRKKISSYDCNSFDYDSIKDDLISFLCEVKEMLDIKEYKYYL
jgi:hypothetical protein